MKRPLSDFIDLVSRLLSSRWNFVTNEKIVFVGLLIAKIFSLRSDAEEIWLIKISRVFKKLIKILETIVEGNYVTCGRLLY